MFVGGGDEDRSPVVEGPPDHLFVEVPGLIEVGPAAMMEQVAKLPDKPVRESLSDLPF
jgi:hypothetical protein